MIIKFSIKKPEHRIVWNLFRYLETFRCGSQVW